MHKNSIVIRKNPIWLERNYYVDIEIEISYMRCVDKDTKDFQEDTIRKVVLQIQIAGVRHSSFEIRWTEHIKDWYRFLAPNSSRIWDDKNVLRHHIFFEILFEEILQDIKKKTWFQKDFGEKKTIIWNIASRYILKRRIQWKLCALEFHNRLSLISESLF